MNFLSLGVNILAGLWLVSYLVKHLGMAAYGLVPLAMLISEYVSIITQSFNAAIQRFLVMEIQGGDTDGAIAVFNTSLLVMLIFIAGQIAVATFVFPQLDTLISIPAGLLQNALQLFVFTFCGFLLSLLASIFSVAMYSHNRIDLQRISDILRQVVRLGTIGLLFTLMEPALGYVGIANLLGGAIVLVYAIINWHRLTPDLRIAPRRADMRRFKPMAAMAGWLLVNQIGYMLFLRIDIFIVNRFIGPEACGEYAAVLQWSQLVRTMAGVLSGAITPLGIIYYARGEIHKLIEMMKITIKIMGLFLAVPLGLLCAFSGDILAIWLGENFRHLGSLMIMQLSPLVINLGVLPLFSLNVVLNKVKVPGVFTCILGGANFMLALLLVQHTRLEYFGVALAGVLVLTFKNALFTPIYAAQLLKLKWWTFQKNYLYSLSVFGMVFLCESVARSFLPALFPKAFLFIAGLLAAGLAFPILWLCLSNNERRILKNMAPQGSRGFFHKVLLVR
jgi:O-antigen/teichoic acid export membrane protein